MILTWTNRTESPHSNSTEADGTATVSVEKLPDLNTGPTDLKQTGSTAAEAVRYTPKLFLLKKEKVCQPDDPDLDGPPGGLDDVDGVVDVPWCLAVDGHDLVVHLEAVPERGGVKGEWGGLKLN